MNIFVEEMLKIMAAILFWIILFPVVLILATPVILVVSIFGRNDRYPSRVANGFCSVYDFWYEWGFWLLPW